MSKDDKVQVLGCYSDAYEARHKTKPTLTRPDLDAAETLFHKQDNSVKQSCQLLAKAFGDTSCSDTLTLLVLADNPDYCSAAHRREGAFRNDAKLHEWNNAENVKNMQDPTR